MKENSVISEKLRVRYRDCFYSGTTAHPVYVDCLRAAPGQRPHLPIVMLHGGFHTGSAYLSAPDGRPGWAPFFARRGHDVFVADWPGHGRSPACPAFADLSTRDIAQALGVLLGDVGPAILFAHSAAGSMAWWLADQFPDKVAAVVGIAPGPPSNIQPALPDDAHAVNALRFDTAAGCPVYSEMSKPVYADLDFIRTYWANATRFPADSLALYAKSVVAESARVLNERFNIGGAGLRIDDAARVAGRPILVITGEHDPRHSRDIDGAVAAYLQADFIWLADIGIHGNGHMLMIEDNSDDVAGVIVDWMLRRGLR